MDIVVLLASFFIIATVIKIAVDNVAEIAKPFIDLTPYKLVIAFTFTLIGVLAYNMGVLEALGVGLEVTRWRYFKPFDLVITSLFLTAGAQVIHQLSDAWAEYQKKGSD